MCSIGNQCRRCHPDDVAIVIQVLRQGAPRPKGACRCPHGDSPSSVLTASGSSTFCGPPELICCPKVASVTDENFRLSCGLNCVCCRSRSQSLDRSTVERTLSRSSNASSTCSRLGPPLSSLHGLGGHRPGRHRLDDCGRCNGRPRSAQLS